MKITKLQQAAETKRVTKSGEKSGGARGPSGSDQAMVSPDALMIANALQEALRLGPISSPVSAERLEALSLAVADGRLAPDPDAIAEAILNDEFLGD